MPEEFPTLDESTGDLVTLNYFSLEEISELLHVSKDTTRRYIFKWDWPHLLIQGRIYMSAYDIGVAMGSLRRGGAPPAQEDRPTLGIAVPPEPFTVPPRNGGGVQ